MQEGLTREVPWVEKYRPQGIADVYYQEEVKLMLSSILANQNMPHLLFYGPPGTGKTSSILALARELFGREQLKNRVLELNASDDRGISAVRERVKTWSRFEAGGKIYNGRMLPSWKIVILDEADMMTADAQSALRRIIELNSRSTRFVLICNHLHKIIEPIISRCAVYRFQPISVEAQCQRLQQICDKEQVRLASPKTLEALHEVSGGDLRRAITILQSASCFYDVLESNTILGVAGRPSIEEPKKFLQACHSSVAEMREAVNDIFNSGWDTSILTEQLVCLLRDSDIDDDITKSRLTIYIAERDYAMLKGASVYLNLLAIGTTMCTILKAAE